MTLEEMFVELALLNGSIEANIILKRKLEEAILMGDELSNTDRHIISMVLDESSDIISRLYAEFKNYNRPIPFSLKKRRE